MISKQRILIVKEEKEKDREEEEEEEEEVEERVDSPHKQQLGKS